MVVTGAVAIAGIGFAGSYTAVRELAVRQGFGGFAPVFPLGIDAGIVVLLALDLLLTWIRIPFPLLRQTAWLLTAATIAFNGAAAWPDPLGVGMHAVIPVLFVVSVEAARHAVGRIADITADKHMEGVRLSRWLLAFPSTFRLWRRMKLWELRSYDDVIRMEQDRLIYEARLRARYGRGWRRRAPVESLMPLKLARYGVPLTETGPAGLAAAGIASTPWSVREPQRRPALGGAEHERAAEHGPLTPRPGTARPAEPAGSAHPAQPEPESEPEPGSGSGSQVEAEAGAGPRAAGDRFGPELPTEQREFGQQEHAEHAESPEHPAYGARPGAGPEPGTGREPISGIPEAPGPPQTADVPQTPDLPQTADVPAAPEPEYAGSGAEAGPQVTVPVGPGRRRALGNASGTANSASFPVPSPRSPQQQTFPEPQPAHSAHSAAPPEPAPAPAQPAARTATRTADAARTAQPEPEPAADPNSTPGGGDPELSDEPTPVGIPDGVPREEFYFLAYRELVASRGEFPTARQLSRALAERHGVTDAGGSLLGEAYLRPYLREFKDRYSTEMGLAG